MEKLTLKTFATSHHLKPPVRGLHDPHTIPGRCGLLYTFDSHRFGVMVLLDSPREWTAKRKACEAVGMEVLQRGDTEGTLLFDPENTEQAAAAIKAARIFKRRRAAPSTPAQLAALTAGRAKRKIVTD